MGLKKDLLNEKVSTLPLREPVTVSSGTIIRAAIAKMKAKSLGCAVVVDYAGKPLGTFTERSVIDLLLSDPTVLDKKTVADHLDPKWITVKQSDPVAEVLNAMQSKDQRFAVVVDEEGRVVGLTGQKGLMECIADYFPEQVFCQRVGTPPVSAREGA
jgi:CBS domain-containing protein